MTNYQISKLSEIVVDNIDKLFNHFGYSSLKRFRGQKNIYTNCMIHGGDGCNSLNIYIGGYRVPFIWKCRTHHCEETFKKTIVGFTRALLSTEKGWRGPDDKELEVSFFDTVKFLCHLYNVDIQDLESLAEDTTEKDKNQFNATAYSSQLRTVVSETVGRKATVSREKVRQSLKIPSEYYLKRGYSPEILDKYDVGTCCAAGKEMYDRAVIPIYDEEGQFMVGCTGRAIWPKCDKCSLFHNPESDCPAPTDKYYNIKKSKWRHNFESRLYLYNYWFAKDEIKKTSSAILVESPGNVLKLEMAGIHNSLATFGNKITDEQQFLLEKAGVMDVTILLDNDEAGKLGREQMRKDLDMYYNLRFMDLPEGVNDVGEMSVDEIKKLFNHQFNGDANL